MDLGIAGKRALVCASSKGLGFGCAAALAQAGVDLVICARTEAPLLEARAKLEAFGVSVTAIVADVTNEAGRAAVLEAAGAVDILINNAGGPPPGHWADWEREDFMGAIDANMLTPIMMIKAVLPNMIENKWGRIVNITSQYVKGPSGILGLSNTARAGLTGYVAGTSRDVAKHGVAMNNLLPGIHATDRAHSLDTKVAQDQGLTIGEARERRAAGIPAQRYGTIEEFGATCAFLCSQHAGFIVGQNVLLDGGFIGCTM